MTFEQIFDEAGLYVAESFKRGVCFEIDKYGYILIVTYEDENDKFPKKRNMDVYKGLFEKDYKKVYTRQSLFKKKPMFK